MISPAIPWRQSVTSIEQRDAQSVLDGVDDLLPLISKRAQAAEDLRQIPDETIAELDEVGFFKLLQPEQWGGLQCDPTVFYEAVRRLGSACGSTGWVSSIIGVHNWHLALFDQQAQDEVWGDDPTVRVSSSYAPMGAGIVVDGGYLVSGAWQWSSGSGHATWAFLGGPVIKDGQPVDFGSFLIPRSEYRIDDVWHVVGLRAPAATPRGQGRVRAPAPLPVLQGDERPHRGWPGEQHRPRVQDALGHHASHHDHGAIMGMAYGAYDAHVEHQGKRVRAAFAGEKSKDDPFAKVRIAEAASDIDAGWRQLIGNVRDEYELLKADKEIPFELRARARRDQVRATARAIASIDLLFEASGATALNSTSPSNGSGVMPTPAACTPPTSPSAPT